MIVRSLKKGERRRFFEFARSLEDGSFRFKERSIEIVQRNKALGKITWDSVENGKTSIGVFVVRSHRGKGFGTALMAKALHKLKAEGIKTIELGVDGNNLLALKLYRKFGFEVHATHFYIAKLCQQNAR